MTRLRETMRASWREVIRVPLYSIGRLALWRDGIVGSHNLFAWEVAP